MKEIKDMITNVDVRLYIVNTFIETYTRNLKGDFHERIDDSLEKISAFSDKIYAPSVTLGRENQVFLKDISS